MAKTYVRETKTIHLMEKTSRKVNNSLRKTSHDKNFAWREHPTKITSS